MPNEHSGNHPDEHAVKPVPPTEQDAAIPPPDGPEGGPPGEQ